MSRSGIKYGDKDPELLLFATPKELAQVYTCIFHQETTVVPKPEQIVQDVHKAVCATKMMAAVFQDIAIVSCLKRQGITTVVNGHG